MAIPELLQRLLEMLGIKQSDNAKFQSLKEKISTSKATKIDQLESLKDQHLALNRQALEKKKEYDTAKSNVKRIIASEIERIFKQIDRLQVQEDIIGQAIDRLDLARVKTDEIIAGSVEDIDEDVFDDLAVELEDVIADLKRKDISSKELEGISYEAPKSDQIDVESRLSELDGTKEVAQDISQSTAQRLKELAGEEE